MKKLALLALPFALLASTAFADDAATANSTQTVDNASYIIGYKMASAMKNQGVSINVSQLNKGFSDGWQGNPSAIPTNQQETILMQYNKAMSQQMLAKAQSQAQQNLTAGQAFLATTAKEPGVKSLPGGLLYKVVTAGNGPMPKATDTVTVNYEGKLINGTVFDSSYERQQPATFPLNQVIKGWTEALTNMPVGSTWIVYIPADLAYGEQAPPTIGPNSVLIFKINLISIKS